MDNFETPLRNGLEQPRSFQLRYGCALVTIALATWVRILLDPALGDHSAFATLLFAVLVTAWYGGIRPALVSVVLGVFFADFFLVPPRGSFGFKGADQYLNLAFYVGVGLGIAIIGGVMHAARTSTVQKLQQA